MSKHESSKLAPLLFVSKITMLNHIYLVVVNFLFTTFNKRIVLMDFILTVAITDRRNQFSGKLIKWIL